MSQILTLGSVMNTVHNCSLFPPCADTGDSGASAIYKGRFQWDCGHWDIPVVYWAGCVDSWQLSIGSGIAEPRRKTRERFRRCGGAGLRSGRGIAPRLTPLHLYKIEIHEICLGRPPMRRSLFLPAKLRL